MIDSKMIPGLVAATGLAAFAFFGGADAQSPAAPVARFLAETANLAAAQESVRIDILAWSSDADRRRFVDAWNLVTSARTGARGAEAPARGAGPPARGGGAGRGAPAGAAGPPAGAARGRGGPGGGRGGPPDGAIAAPAAAAAETPATALAAALQSATGVGYLWSSESVGYSLRYAYRMTQPDGSVRIVLATDRRLGESNATWTPAAGAPNDYTFSVIELRLNPAMEGEGKASLTGTVFVDAAAGTIALEDYSARAVTLTNVRPAQAY